MYVGGDFDSAEGAGRRHLAAFNATSGNISTAFKPTVSNGAGNFATVLSMAVSPNNQTLRTSGGTLQSWAPAADGVFGAFGAAITSSRVAVGGAFTTVASQAHQGAVQFSGTP